MTATPVDKTYVMLMVADMARAMRFYTEAFAATVVINHRTGASSLSLARRSPYIPAAAAARLTPDSASRYKILMRHCNA
jgi:uncharacterized glyoxalase superfamily protein PhnB